MDLYMAGSTFNGLNEWMQDMGYNKLLSYLNDKPAIKAWQDYIDKTGKTKSKLFIDSGAFTAWTKGAQIDVDEYINWLNERKDFITLFGQVDKIPGDIKTGATSKQVKEAAEETWQNYLYMRERVINKDGLLYTFHVGEPYKYLEQALEWKDENGNHIKYIALGGMVGKPSNVKIGFLNKCFEIISNSNNPNVQVHTFGMTSLNLLTSYPITSADSTGWIMTAVTGSVFSPYGNICLSVETQTNNTKEVKNNLVDIEVTNAKNFINLPKYKQDLLLEYINKTGFKLKELQNDYRQREKFNIKYLQEWSERNFYEKPKVKPGILINI